MSFDSLGLNPDILRAIAEQGYREPTPIQQQAIPAGLPISRMLKVVARCVR